MTKPINLDPCCKHLTGEAREWCEKDTRVLPTVYVFKPKCEEAEKWAKFSTCRYDQFKSHLMTMKFEKNMKQVTKAVQSVTKSDGNAVGALVLIFGIITSAIDAVQAEPQSDKGTLSRSELDKVLNMIPGAILIYARSGRRSNSDE